jgi:hypothetical protein
MIRDIRRGGSIPPLKIEIPEGGGGTLNNFHKPRITFFCDGRPPLPADVPDNDD